MYVVNNYSVETTPTLDRFIDAKPINQISFYYLSLNNKDTSNNIEYCSHNILDDYLDDIKEVAQRVTLSEEEYIKFRFKPKLLANYLYGNSELYFIILLINDMCSVKDFDIKELNLVKRSDLTEILSSISMSEKSNIDLHNQSIDSI